MFRMACTMFLALALACMLGGCVIAPSAGPTTPDGLQRRPDSRLDSVYAAPGASLMSYRRVMLDEPDVAFKADWQARSPGISAQEIGDIRMLAARLFRAAFTSELEQGGYAIAGAPAADVLRVKASVVDLDFAPASAATAGVAGAYVVSIADISLLAELRDSQSGAVIARVIDRKRGRDMGNLQMASEASASKDAVRAFGTWAGLLREALDEARRPFSQ